MKYSIEIGKIIEGALKHDQMKVLNYANQLIYKLEVDNDVRAASKIRKMLDTQSETTLSAMGLHSESVVPVDTESRMTLADVVLPENNEIDVILSKRNFEQLESFVMSYKNADKLNSMGLGLSNTLMLYGPPGCGKTKCAYLIAKRLQLPLVVARLDSLISSYLGTTAKNIRALFDYAQRTPCVLFLDEFDAIAKARDDSNELGELKRVVNSLLQNVDAMSKDSILIAATNHEQLLDPAVWRRFDYKLQIDLPDSRAIEQMLDVFLRDSLSLSIDEKQELACVMKGLSGANVEEIVMKALRNAIVHGVEISKQDIFEYFFNFKGLIPPTCEDEKKALQIKARYLRQLDEKRFSLQVIASILGCSKTTVQKLVKEVEV